jgi:hypothetical protein
MRTDLPELQTILPLILEVESRFEGPLKRILAWVDEHRREIENNRRLIVA